MYVADSCWEGKAGMIKNTDKEKLKINTQNFCTRKYITIKTVYTKISYNTAYRQNWWKHITIYKECRLYQCKSCKNSSLAIL